MPERAFFENYCSNGIVSGAAGVGVLSATGAGVPAAGGWGTLALSLSPEVEPQAENKRTNTSGSKDARAFLISLFFLIITIILEH